MNRPVPDRHVAAPDRSLSRPEVLPTIMWSTTFIIAPTKGLP